MAQVLCVIRPPTHLHQRHAYRKTTPPTPGTTEYPVQSWSSIRPGTCSLARDGGAEASPLGDLVGQGLQAPFYVRGRAGESEGRGVEADLVRADSDGCGR